MCKIYHIIHVDRLRSIIQSQGLFSDALVRQYNLSGTVIGMSSIKERRLTQCELTSHPGLYVGACVPFYFCPRSVMLYMMYKRNSELEYKGGQESIVHLVSDLKRTISYAQHNCLRWAFTSSNAGSGWFDDFSDVKHLDKIQWDIVNSNQWGGNAEWKQAEFLIENSFHWNLVESIGVYDNSIYQQVASILQTASHSPGIMIKREWYY